MTLPTSPTTSVTTIRQQFYCASLPPIILELVDFPSLTIESVSNLLATIGDGTKIGVAATYGKKCVLDTLAFSTETRVLLIMMGESAKGSTRQKQILEGQLLCNVSLGKHGFFMERIAAGLYMDFGLRIRNAFDITSDGDKRGSMAAYKGVLARARTQHPLDEPVVEKIFADQPFILSRKGGFALRAWACYIGVQGLPEKPGAIDTMAKASKERPDRPLPPTEQELKWLCKCVRDADRLDSLKPHYTENDVSTEISVKKGAVNLQCTRFKTRIRQSDSQHIRFRTDHGEIKGHVKNVQGRAVRVAPQARITAFAKITSVVTIGKEELNSAEAFRAALVLDAFKGRGTLFSSPFVRKIFFPGFPLRNLKWPELPTTKPKVNFIHRPLNPSQKKAVEKCISNREEDRHVIVVGPPGTGKTTVIAASVQSKIAEDPSNTVWVIAQSNVAVKNVAEKLAECNFLDFRLLVSKDFHFDWHEHLYEVIRHNVIESGDFKRTTHDNARLVLGARVMLCTINMLSTNKLTDFGFTKIVPVQTVIIDEASQIEAGDYLPILARYKTTLRKIVFIGDDKQLAPYGQEDIPELQSVFEWPHLRENSVFLNTQYRMPSVIGNFISRHVYDSKLLTKHDIHTHTCCRFVDVSNGKEIKKGVSWTNEGEVKIAVHMAKRYILKGEKFKIITPYDAQRNAIEKALKNAGLPWESTVFNVDSFQGNEADHIIVSIVRTSSPGFMKNKRRTNVMLSRCKKSMMILTNRGFLLKKNVARTLVGKFASEHVTRTGWVTLQDLALNQW